MHPVRIVILMLLAPLSAAARANAGEREIMTNVEIAAPPARVWAILTDFPTMPSWNPFIRSISGDLAEGARLDVTIAPPGQVAMKFSPTLLAVRKAQELRWRGSLIASGLFAGEHSFLLETGAGETTHFTQSEHFSGLLAPMLMNEARLAATRAGFEAMNAELKRRAEAK